MSTGPAALWRDALAAAAGCLALLRRRPDAFSFFDLTLAGLVGAMLAAVISMTVVIALLYAIPGDRQVSASVVLLGLWGAVGLRELTAYLFARGAGRQGRYLAHGVPAFWMAAFQPMLFAVFTLVLFLLSRVVSFPTGAVEPVFAIALIALTGASMLIAFRTLRHGVGLGTMAIGGLFAAQAFSLAVSFVGFGLLLQLAGYSTATR